MGAAICLMSGVHFLLCRRLVERRHGIFDSVSIEGDILLCSYLCFRSFKEAPHGGGANFDCIWQKNRQHMPETRQRFNSRPDTVTSDRCRGGRFFQLIQSGSCAEAAVHAKSNAIPQRLTRHWFWTGAVVAFFFPWIRSTARLH